MEPTDLLPVSLADLERALARPARFEPHDAPFWDDPYIAARMLEAHLDPSSDAASMRPDVVRRTVDHLTAVMGLRAGDRLVDLGCGPGLYAAQFAERGLAVTGIDLSANSIGYARTAAAAVDLAIEYRIADYTAETLGGPFEAAVLIYLDFGVLPDEPRDRLLDGVRAALTSGGRFALDVHAPARRRAPDAGVTVERSSGGFWRPGPHLAITTTYRYGPNLDLTQHAIFEPGRASTVYRVWDRAYGIAELRTLLRRHGLRLEATWSDLTGRPWSRRSPVLAVVARRL
ncbi:MAG TPA: class I SAM-dependent methyltransferase [Clostridia bacterium]|nr:class I SAM-dependent methyltransferase [Clostridia bacterium]